MSGSVTMLPLGDLCDVVGGGTPAKDKSQYYNGDIPWATVRDMRSEVIADTEFSITREAVANSATNIIPSGNVVIATRVGLGKVCLIERPTAINQDLRGILPRDPDRLTVRYLFWWLKSVTHLIESAGNGATVQGVRLPFIKSLQLPLRSVSEQRRIVAILEEAFEGIATAEANVEKSFLNSISLFEGCLRSAFTQRGDGWVESRLGDVCDLLNGFAFKSSDSVKESHTQLIRMGNLYGNRLNLDRFPIYYPDSFARSYQKYLLMEGDLVISLTGTTGKQDYGYTVRVAECGRSLLMNQRIAKFHSLRKELVDQDFLFYYLRSRSFLDILYPTANGTRQANLSSVTIKTLPIPLCSLGGQEAIANRLEAIEVESKRLENVYQRKLAALQELKKSLLHQAFTGQL